MRQISKAIFLSLTFGFYATFCLLSASLYSTVTAKASSKIDSVTTFLEANGKFFPEETAIIWDCADEAASISNDQCGKIARLLSSIGDEVPNLNFFKAEKFEYWSLNFVFFSEETSKVEEKMIQTKTIYNKEDLEIGCLAINYFPSAESSYIFALNNESNLEVCLGLSFLHYLGFEGLSQLKTKEEIRTAISNIFKVNN